MPEIEVQTEQEIPRGWTYRVRIGGVGGAGEGGGSSEHTVTLSWADHEFWTGGTTPPSRLMEALLRYLVERRGAQGKGKDPGPEEIPAKFDASTIRRWYPEVDSELSL